MPLKIFEFPDSCESSEAAELPYLKRATAPQVILPSWSSPHPITDQCGDTKSWPSYPNSGQFKAYSCFRDTLLQRSRWGVPWACILAHFPLCPIRLPFPPLHSHWSLMSTLHTDSLQKPASQELRVQHTLRQDHPGFLTLTDSHSQLQICQR